MIAYILQQYIIQAPILYKQLGVILTNYITVLKLMAEK